ncbi:unnamed protein product, partial [Meganyctiphanes norvegica]
MKEDTFSDKIHIILVEYLMQHPISVIKSRGNHMKSLLRKSTAAGLEDEYSSQNVTLFHNMGHFRNCNSEKMLKRLYRTPAMLHRFSTRMKLTKDHYLGYPLKIAACARSFVYHVLVYTVWWVRYNVLLLAIITTSMYKLCKSQLHKLQSIIEDTGKVVFYIIMLNYVSKAKIIHLRIHLHNQLIENRRICICIHTTLGHEIDNQTLQTVRNYKLYQRPKIIHEHAACSVCTPPQFWILGVSIVSISRISETAQGTSSENRHTVVMDDPPRLPPGAFSSDFDNFIEQVLVKDYQQRPNYQRLLEHPFISNYSSDTSSNSGFAEFINENLPPQPSTPSQQ